MRHYINYVKCVLLLAVCFCIGACSDSAPFGREPSLTVAYYLVLDKTEITLAVGETATLTATVLPENATEHSVIWTSSDTSVATVSSDGKVTAVSAGTTTVTATSVSDAGMKATCMVTVTDNFTNGHEYVDLGLTSGTLWATCNVGASSPSDYGGYYAWGETSTKSKYSVSNYKWSNGSYYTFTKYNTQSNRGVVDNKTVLDLSDDAARANWGGSWRMPTEAEFKELKNECTWTWTTMNGKNGYKVSSKKNNSYIFLPAAGEFSFSLNDAGSDGNYWSSSLNDSNTSYAYQLGFDSNYINMYFPFREYGRSVRPVLRK